MNQEEKMQIVFRKLKENIGREVRCICYSNGLRKEVFGILKEVCDGYYVSIGNEKYITDILPFIEVNNIILAILSDDEVLYLNNDVHGNARLFSREEVEKMRQEHFGKEISKNNLNQEQDLTEQEKIILRTFNEAIFPDVQLSISDFKTGRLTLVKETGVWKLYLNDEERKLLNEFDNLHDACLYAIFIMSKDERVQKEMLYDFGKALLEATNKLKKEESFHKTRR